MNDQFNKDVAEYTQQMNLANLPSEVVAKSQGSSISEKEKKAAELVQSTWDSYKNTTKGAAKVAAMKTNMSLEEVLVTIKDIYQGAHFKSCRTSLITMDTGLLKSVSIGVGASVALVVGATVSAGCVFDIQNPLYVSGYVTGGVLAGADAEIDVTEELGFWNCYYNDFGGISYGIVAAGEEIGGIAVGVYGSTPEIFDALSGFTVAAAEGEGFEVSYVASKTILVDAFDSLRPVFQFPKSHLMILTKLVCNDNSDDGAGDEDEVYFTFRADKDIVYYMPKTNYYSMKDHGDFQTWDCGRSVWFDDFVDIYVYDQDDTSNDDVIGSGKISLSDLPSNGSEKGFNLKQDNGASYTIYAKLIQTS